MLMVNWVKLISYYLVLLMMIKSELRLINHGSEVDFGIIIPTTVTPPILTKINQDSVGLKPIKQFLMISTEQQLLSSKWI